MYAVYNNFLHGGFELILHFLVEISVLLFLGIIDFELLRLANSLPDGVDLIKHLSHVFGESVFDFLSSVWFDVVLIKIIVQ